MILLVSFFNSLEEFYSIKEKQYIEQNIMQLLLPNIVPLSTLDKKEESVGL